MLELYIEGKKLLRIVFTFFAVLVVYVCVCMGAHKSVLCLSALSALVLEERVLGPVAVQGS